MLKKIKIELPFKNKKINTKYQRIIVLIIKYLKT